MEVFLQRFTKFLHAVSSFHLFNGEHGCVELKYGNLKPFHIE